jgi:hypothetical protein
MPDGVVDDDGGSDEDKMETEAAAKPLDEQVQVLQDKASKIMDRREIGRAHV